MRQRMFYVTVTSEDVCWSLWNVKSINENFLQHALSRYVHNRSLFDIFTELLNLL